MLQNGGAMEERTFCISTIIRFGDKETAQQHSNLKNVLDDNCHCNFFGCPLLLYTIYHTEYFWCGKYTLKTNTTRNNFWAPKNPIACGWVIFELWPPTHSLNYNTSCL